MVVTVPSSGLSGSRFWPQRHLCRGKRLTTLIEQMRDGVVNEHDRYVVGGVSERYATCAEFADPYTWPEPTLDDGPPAILSFSKAAFKLLNPRARPVAYDDSLAANPSLAYALHDHVVADMEKERVRNDPLRLVSPEHIVMLTEVADSMSYEREWAVIGTNRAYLPSGDLDVFATGHYCALRGQEGAECVEGMRHDLERSLERDGFGAAERVRLYDCTANGSNVRDSCPLRYIFMTDEIAQNVLGTRENGGKGPNH